MNMFQGFDDSKMYESIFGQHHPWNESTLPGRFHKPGWHGYALAYKTAGDRVVDGQQIGPFSEHFQVFPIMSLYRHYLELELKGILLVLRGWDGGNVQALPGHKLTSSWDEVRQLLEKFDNYIIQHWGGVDAVQLKKRDDLYNAVEQRVKEFDEIDAKSQNFRYPVNRNLEPNPAKLLDRHEILHIKEVVNALYDNLDGISVGLHETIDQWNEQHFW